METIFAESLAYHSSWKFSLSANMVFFGVHTALGPRLDVIVIEMRVLRCKPTA